MSVQNELEVLKWIDSCGTITQRDIAKRAGVSLGNVNTIISRLIDNGMLRMEKLNQKTIKYSITSVGYKRRTEEIYKKILSSYKLIEQFNNKVHNFFYCDCENIIYFLYGENDEICKCIIEALNDNKKAFTLPNNFNELEEFINNIKIANRKRLKEFNILIWQPDLSDVLRNNGIEHINLLEIMYI